MQLQVFSEIGRLNEVMTHTPGLEVDRMPPALMEELLFDDILNGEAARDEHNLFCRAIESFGVRNHDFQDLLTHAIEHDSEAAHNLCHRIARHEHLSEQTVRRLAKLSGKALAEALVCGLHAEEHVVSSDHFFDLDPLPNLLMSRDPQVVIGNGVIISSMRRGARAREAQLSQFVFAHHPEFRNNERYFDFHGDAKATHDPRFGSLTLEGGDVLVLKEGVVAVGVSERTMEQSIDLLAQALRKQDWCKTLIMVRMPGSRSQMHLDTIFTRISETECLVYPPMFYEGYAETLSVVSLDLKGGEDDYGRRHKSFFHACRAAGVDLEPVPCGGEDDYIQQTREQWTDGANSFALAPGFILLYARNQATLKALAARHYKAVPAADFVANPEPVKAAYEAGQKHVITLPSSELSRARGGPRCMTMPLHREL